MEGENLPFSGWDNKVGSTASSRAPTLTRSGRAELPLLASTLNKVSFYFHKGVGSFASDPLSEGCDRMVDRVFKVNDED